MSETFDEIKKHFLPQKMFPKYRNSSVLICLIWMTIVLSWIGVMRVIGAVQDYPHHSIIGTFVAPFLFGPVVALYLGCFFQLVRNFYLASDDMSYKTFLIPILIALIFFMVMWAVIYIQTNIFFEESRLLTKHALLFLTGGKRNLP